MAETADWTTGGVERTATKGTSWVKFAIGGIIIVAAIALLLYSTTQSNAQYMVTVTELQQRSAEMVGKDARVSGIVVPDSISYDASSLHLEFDVVDQVGSAEQPLRIILDGEPLPDQMQDEAEAIAEGQLQSDGTFHADTLMMKCASKYEVEIKE